MSSGIKELKLNDHNVLGYFAQGRSQLGGRMVEKAPEWQEFFAMRGGKVGAYQEAPNPCKGPLPATKRAFLGDNRGDH